MARWASTARLPLLRVRVSEADVVCWALPRCGWRWTWVFFRRSRRPPCLLSPLSLLRDEPAGTVATAAGLAIVVPVAAKVTVVVVPSCRRTWRRTLKAHGPLPGLVNRHRCAGSSISGRSGRCAKERPNCLLLKLLQCALTTSDAVGSRWGADAWPRLFASKKAIVWNDRAVPQHVSCYEHTVHKSEAWPLIHFLLLL